MPLTHMKNEERFAVTIENEGEKIFGVLHLPISPPSTPPPIVVVLHGYAGTKLGSKLCYVTLAKSLTSAGLGCLRFDFRGSGDSEGTLSKMLIEHFVSDLLAVCAHLHQLRFSTLCFFGSSFGGAIALLASNIISVRSLALWAPVASGNLWYQDYQARGETEPISSYHGVILSETFKEQFFHLRADKALSSLEHIPLLHMQNTEDTIVSLRHRAAFEQCRQDTDAPTLFKLYPDKEHQLGKSSSFPDVLRETVEWFLKTV